MDFKETHLEKAGIFMKGKHHIVIETENIKYEFDIKRNITVIQGDSATGKTTMVDIINEYAHKGAKQGIRIQSDVKCAVFNSPEEQWEYFLAGHSESIVFIDENNRFVFTKEFAAYVGKSNNYYVIITRKPLKNLPYSINEIYGIRTSGKYHFPDQVYNEFYPIHQDADASCELSDFPIMILVEDKESAMLSIFFQSIPLTF